MVIGINGRLLVAGKLDGIGWYTHELLRRIVQRHPEVRFVLTGDRPIDPSFLYGPNVTPVHIQPRARHSILHEYWYQWALPRALRLHGVDLFVSLDGFIPLRAGIPTVDVIHDMGFFQYPDQLDPITVRYFRRRFPDCARAATRLATVSEYSRQDIARLCQIPVENISVVSNAAREVFAPLAPKQQASVRTLRSNGAPYFVFVGVIQPRKNLTTVLQAFDRFKTEHGTDHKLVIAGRHGWRYGDVTHAYEGMIHKNDVVFTGYLSDEDLATTVAAASALTMVPHFEGFGIPILEAMACGTPVITSNVTSLPEVAGDAALFVAPTDVNALSSAMARIIHEPLLAQDLSVRGLARSHSYSWDHSADRLWELVTSALDR